MCFSTQMFTKDQAGLTALLNTFAIFAIGFFMRPIGGLLMGAVADRLKRKTALTATILLMRAGSLLIAVLGQLLASGLAALLAHLLSESDMGFWGWRIPVLFGAVLSLVGLAIRARALETLENIEDLRQGRVARPGIFDALRFHPRESLLIVRITIAGTIAISLVFFGVLQPIAGKVSDRIGRRPLLITFAAAFALLTVPGLGSLNDSPGRLLLVQCIGWSSSRCSPPSQRRSTPRTSLAGCGPAGSASPTRSAWRSSVAPRHTSAPTSRTPATGRSSPGT